MNVNPSPLFLLRYFFSEVSVKAEDNGDVDAIVNFRGGIGEIPKEGPAKDAFPSAPDDSHGPYAVKLEVALENPTEGRARYTGKVVLMGIFAFKRGVIENEDKQEIETIVMVNGNSMLYGMAREMIHNITARGPALPFILQSVSFTPPPVKGAKPTADAIAAPAQKKEPESKPKKKG
jgi:hypothetical protein